MSEHWGDGRDWDYVLGRARAARIHADSGKVAILAAGLSVAWFCWEAATEPLDTETTWLLALRSMVATLLYLGAVAMARRTRPVAPVLSIAPTYAITFAFYLCTMAVFTERTPVDELGFASFLALPFLMAGATAASPLTVPEAAGCALIAVLAAALAMIFGFTFHGLLWGVAVLGLMCASSSQRALQHVEIALSHRAFDALTGAYSRAVGGELIEALFHAAERRKEPLTIAFVDIDRFKPVNDRYGHEAGDALLRGVAQALLENKRRSDIVIRWGGEEFLILLPSTPADGTLPALRRIANAGLPPRPDGVPTTASIGIAERIADQAATPQELVALADGRMYGAKAMGRNSIALAETYVPFIAPERDFSPASGG
ncbi:MAG: diguanylate cyclase [Alphaproteobacteria bacterium]